MGFKKNITFELSLYKISVAVHEESLAEAKLIGNNVITTYNASHFIKTIKFDLWFYPLDASYGIKVFIVAVDVSNFLSLHMRCR